MKTNIGNDNTPEVTIDVDGKINGVSTLWAERTVRCSEFHYELIDPSKSIYKTLGLDKAKYLANYLQKRIDFYESDYFKWGQRKTGSKHV